MPQKIEVRKYLRYLKRRIRKEQPVIRRLYEEIGNPISSYELIGPADILFNMDFIIHDRVTGLQRVQYKDRNDFYYFTLRVTKPKPPWRNRFTPP